MTRRHLAWPAMILLSTVAVSVVTYAGIWPSVRPVVALPFLVLCPGMAWARLLRVEPELNQILLAVALSLAIDTIVSTALLYAHQPSAEASVGALIAITVGGLLADPTLRRLLIHRTLPHPEVTA
jgi:uncharacterized membrane protein